MGDESDELNFFQQGSKESLKLVLSRGIKLNYKA